MIKPALFITITFLLLSASCRRSVRDLYWKADRAVEKNQWSKAVNIYDELIKRTGNQDAFFMKAYCLQQDSNYVQAAFFFNRLLIIKGVNLDDTNSRYQVEMNFTPAFSEHGVTHAEIYYQLAITQYEMDSLAKSFANFQRAIDRNYEKANSLTWQGLIWTRYNKAEKACTLFGEARGYGDPDAHRLYQQFCSQTGKP